MFGVCWVQGSGLVRFGDEGPFSGALKGVKRNTGENMGMGLKALREYYRGLNHYQYHGSIFLV